MHESGVVEDMSLTSMMMEDIERTLVRLERRRMKTLYCTFEKDRFKPRVEKNANNEGKKYMLNMIEEIVKTLNFDTISTMMMKGNEGAKSKEHANDCISKSEMKTNSDYTINKMISYLNLHIIR